MQAAIDELMEDPDWMVMKRAQGRQEGMDTPSLMKHTRAGAPIKHVLQKISEGHNKWNGLNSFTFPKSHQHYQKHQ